MNVKIVKVVGYAVTIIGFGLKFISDWVDDKKTEAIIDKKVNKAMIARFGKEDSDTLVTSGTMDVSEYQSTTEETIDIK